MLTLLYRIESKIKMFGMHVCQIVLSGGREKQRVMRSSARWPLNSVYRTSARPLPVGSRWRLHEIKRTSSTILITP